MTELLTTDEAAQLLHVSSTHIRSLIASEALPVSSTENANPRIFKYALLAYKEQMDARQLKGLGDMVSATVAVGLYDAELMCLPALPKREA